MVAMGEKQGFVALRRGAGPGAGGRTNLAEAAATGLPVEGVVTGVNKGGLEVDVAACARSARCRSSSCGRSPIRPPTSAGGWSSGSRVTRRIAAAPTWCCRGARCSRRRRRPRRRDARQGGRGRGAAGRGDGAQGLRRVRRRGRHRGLLPASEISFQRGTRPADVLTVGQPVTVQVHARREARRCAAARAGVVLAQGARARSLAGRGRQFRPGTVVRGQVMRAEPFGAFVQLAPGVEGLIHISELGRGAAAAPRARSGQAGRRDRGRGARARARQAPHLARPRRAARSGSTTKAAPPPRAPSGRGGRHGDAGRSAQGQAARALAAPAAPSFRSDGRFTVEMRANSRILG